MLYSCFLLNIRSLDIFFPGSTIPIMADAKARAVLKKLLADPEVREVIHNDVWALYDGKDTIGHYDVFTWWLLKTTLDEFSEDELVELAGPRSKV